MKESIIAQELRKKIVPIYEELLENKFDEKVCVFAAQWGENFPSNKNEGLLFVGKAVNGWKGNDSVDNLFDEKNSEGIFDRDDQMEWVHDCWGNKEGYNTKKSPFWRVIKKSRRNLLP